jgi:hypothetical protein
MTYPVYDTSRTPDPLDVRGGPVTCASCGCRLQLSDDGQEVWRHFAPMGGRDARGCLVSCVDQPHNSRGQAILTA